MKDGKLFCLIIIKFFIHLNVILKGRFSSAKIEGNKNKHGSRELPSAMLNSQIGTLRSNDADGIENVQKTIGFYKKNNHFARASHFFVHFFARFCTTTT